MTNLRPLQPAPMDQDDSPQSQSRPMLIQKPKRTVTPGACVACRKRKSKCDGQRPACACCAQKETECIYGLGPNEKPSQAMKRKNEEMRGELMNLRQLYDFLRLRPEQEALWILRRIRADPPDTMPFRRIQELVEFTRHGELGAQRALPPAAHHQSSPVTLPPLRMALDSFDCDPSTFTSSLNLPSGLFFSDARGTSSRRPRYASDTDVSARLGSQGSLPPPTTIDAILQEPALASRHESIDPRLISARNWTNVIDDTDLIIHLLSAWHRWEYKYYHFLDWESFIQDMASGGTNFCSKLLVNSLLASASFLSSVVKDRSKPFGDNIITSFYKEAQRLWEVEEGQDSLPKLQAAILLFFVQAKHGRDKAGHPFLVRACRIARDLGLFRLSPSASIQKPQGVLDERWQRSRAVTAWALFNFQMLMSFTYSSPVLLKSQPPLPIPYDDAPETEALFRSECARQVIMLDCSSILWDADIVDSDLPPKPEQVEVLSLRLKSWWDSRPEVLDPDKNSTPETLLFAMIHHTSHIRLVQPFLSRDSSLERVKAYRDRARSIYSTSIKEVRRLLIHHEVRHGWVRAIPLVLHPIMVVSFDSIEELSHEAHSKSSLDSSEPYQILLTCLRALCSLSSSIFYAQPLFRIITQTCQSVGIKLPIETMSTLDHYQSEQWTRNVASMVSSQYVADMRRAATDVENGRMDSVIAQWDALTIGEKSSSTVSGEDTTEN